MAGEILRAEIAKDPRLVLLSEVSGPDGVRDTLTATHVDAVIVGLQGTSLPAGYEPIVKQNPDLRVLGLSDDARVAFAFELRVVPRLLGTISAGSLLAALRETPGVPPGGG